MANRAKTKRIKDKKVFKRTAAKTKQINIKPKIMRGGIRM